MEQKFITELDLSDYTIVDYRNGHGKGVNFYVAYYESQRKGESIHSPETCLPGSGWDFRQSGTTTIALAGHNPTGITVNRAFMEKGGQRQLSYFWFPQRGRVLTNAYQLKLFTFWDALTRQRTDGALVRLITPIYDREEVADAEKRLQSFTRDIVPVLNEHLPK
jgi:EpsI family protein